MFREMRRRHQQMTEAECLEILCHEKRGVLAVLGDGGYPYAVPLNFIYDNGGICFHCAKEGHKTDAIRSCEKGSFNVIRERKLSDDGWSYYVDSVTVFGRLREVPDEEKTDKLRLLGHKYFPTAEMTESDIAKNACRCTVIELKIEHMTGKHVHER